MSFVLGSRIAHEFLDDVVRVYRHTAPNQQFEYHLTRVEGALADMPSALGLVFTVLTRLDVDSEKVAYASCRLTGTPELNYLYG